ncbi:hypothetical protein, partial [Salmonella enterica]|uniref:hypothetical protein n=1 Tax=Salmonella enterica TaxID=28901 RepID=UPI003D2E016E
SGAEQLINTIENKNYDLVIVGLHNFSRRPANNFSISKPSLYLLNSLQRLKQSVHIVFGNPYAIKNFCNADNLMVAYEDDDDVQN